MGCMKTFGEVKKGDKVYVVNTGTSIPGRVEIIEQEALTDYTNDLPYANTTLFGIMFENLFGGEIPLCFNKDDTHSGMYFTTLEEAKQHAIKKADEILDQLLDTISKMQAEIFKLHEAAVILNIKKKTWE